MKLGTTEDQKTFGGAQTSFDEKLPLMIKLKKMSNIAVILPHIKNGHIASCKDNTHPQLKQ